MIERCRFLSTVLFILLFSFLFSFLFFISRDFLKQPEKIHVLFIGNSLTSVNGLPYLFTELARSRGHQVGSSIYAPGGYKLSQHASDPRLLAEIRRGGWDFVVLQEQSQLPAFSQEQVRQEVYPFAQKLSQSIRRANPQARVVFYMTMAKKNGDTSPENLKEIPALGTYEGMQKRLETSYINMARQNQGLLVPVGLVWEKVRSQYPAIDLYSDDTHPSLTGTYLAACVFDAVLFKDDPVGLPHPKEIDDRTAERLQRITEETVK